MITKALYDYLTSVQPITGAPATDFRAVQSVAGLSVPNRETARRYLRARIGNEIYSVRRPRTGSHNTAVSLRLIVTNREDELTGGSTLADAIIQIDVWTRFGDAPLRGAVCGHLIKLCCVGFGSEAWGDTNISDCICVREAEFVEQPDDGDDWQFRYSMDLQVFYQQPSPVI